MNDLKQARTLVQDVKSIADEFGKDLDKFSALLTQLQSSSNQTKLASGNHAAMSPPVLASESLRGQPQSSVATLPALSSTSRLAADPILNASAGFGSGNNAHVIVAVTDPRQDTPDAADPAPAKHLSAFPMPKSHSWDVQPKLTIQSDTGMEHSQSFESGMVKKPIGPPGGTWGLFSSDNVWAPMPSDSFLARLRTGSGSSTNTPSPSAQSSQSHISSRTSSGASVASSGSSGPSAQPIIQPMFDESLLLNGTLSGPVATVKPLHGPRRPSPHDHHA